MRVAPLPTCRACLHSAGGPDEDHFTVPPPTDRLGAVSSGQRTVRTIPGSTFNGSLQRATVGVLQPQKLANTKNRGFSRTSSYEAFTSTPLSPSFKKLSQDKVPARQALLSNQREQACMHFKKQQATGKDAQHF